MLFEEAVPLLRRSSPWIVAPVAGKGDLLMRFNVTLVLLLGMLWTGSSYGLNVEQPPATEAPNTGTASEDVQYARPNLLMEPTQLADPAIAENFVILDARSQEEYDRGHVPGARRVDHDSWKGAYNEGKDPEGWSKRIGALGIDASSQVVIYDDTCLLYTSDAADDRPRV